MIVRFSGKNARFGISRVSNLNVDVKSIYFIRINTYCIFLTLPLPGGKNARFGISRGRNLPVDVTAL